MTEEAKVSDVQQRSVQFTFPILIVRTQLFQGVFDRLGAFRFSRFASWIMLAFVPVLALAGLYFLFISLLALLWQPSFGEVIREIGPGTYVMLPGVNPLLPLLYGWVAIISAIAIHEGAHGVIARNLNLTVKSSGLLFFLCVPIGAFVDVDEEQLKRAKAKVSLRVLASGVGGNLAAAAACLLGVLLIVSGAVPIVDGVYILDSVQGMPAQEAGLLAGDVLIAIDGFKVNSTENLRTLLDAKKPGDAVEVIVARGEMWRMQYKANVTLAWSENRTVMGVKIADLYTREVLSNYLTFTLAKLPMYFVPPALNPSLVPFSDAYAGFYQHWLGAAWHVPANMLFYMWFVNFNVALFNALPIYPLDGGRMFNIALKGISRLKKHVRLVSTITWTVTFLLISVILLTFLIPFLT